MTSCVNLDQPAAEPRCSLCFWEALWSWGSGFPYRWAVGQENLLIVSISRVRNAWQEKSLSWLLSGAFGWACGGPVLGHGSCLTYFCFRCSLVVSDRDIDVLKPDDKHTEASHSVLKYAWMEWPSPADLCSSTVTVLYGSLGLASYLSEILYFVSCSQHLPCQQLTTLPLSFRKSIIFLESIYKW